MSTFYCVVEGADDTRSGRRERRRVGGGKTLDDARKSAQKVLKRDKAVDAIVIETDDGDGVKTVDRVERAATPDKKEK